ncbi:DNA topoisomerase I, catalytic core [Pseudomonas cuatrocienegasensis]|uniref:DNA topoisomerase I, catalytic core n=1 Tax=Pseudomonas cuatrocienegasensis TaxID=543360 RepID=A0ABY1BF79_9PSED|nr:hypothetical protein A7D25_07405 [Pseudomonas sp. 21C1]SEQ72330.1 DNA topoisomerase I, catalytic core [Pseudomonas cuatrocienegasensis]
MPTDLHYIDDNQPGLRLRAPLEIARINALRNRHVEVHGSGIRFHFRGKSGIEHGVSLDDRRLARVIRRCLDLPGQHLFQDLDEQDERRAVGFTDVNAYLRELTGADFTAKDYRTWACCASSTGNPRAHLRYAASAISTLR